MNCISTFLSGLALLTLIAGPVRAGDDPGIVSGNEASPNFVGSTGLLLTPNAETVGDKGFSVFGSFNPRFDSVGVLFGPIDRLEVGLTFLNQDCDCFDDAFAVNAKFNLLKETDLIPGFSVGVVDAFDELGVDTSWYLVASKDLRKLLPILPFDVKGNLGYGGGIYRDEPFASLEIGIGTPLDAIPVTRPSFAFIPEVRDGEVNLGLRGKWKGFGATIALFDFDRVGVLFSYSAGLRL